MVDDATRKHAGGRPKATVPTSRLPLAEVAAMRREGKSFHAIGLRFGVTADAVRQFWKRWGHASESSE